ncbi:hypothetical protein [Leptolyngbya sp. FACHB-261]|uniref:hypothetical protein n=1 Tax=Leptolyngbya sp. FACHB-261 TaxID=2692806 RepID=UPI001685A752|nr:hypothetical protein [Leptolyngbya sp. FACHB-261]MBD2103781.1 hypothetical protein [Leptolyngbya sp. FACHB-261]
MKSAADVEVQVVEQAPSQSVVSRAMDLTRGKDRGLLLLVPFACYFVYFAAMAVYVMRSFG